MFTQGQQYPVQRNACAWSFQMFAYPPSCLSSSWCVPASTMTESFIYLTCQSATHIRTHPGTNTHRIKSAWRVRFPKRCEEKSIVLLPRSSRRRSKRSAPPWSR